MRLRSYRRLKLSVFLIVYSVFHSVLGAPSEPDETKVELWRKSRKQKEVDIFTDRLENYNIGKLTDKPRHGRDVDDASSPEERVYPTLRPRRNCSPPAIEQNELQINSDLVATSTTEKVYPTLRPARTCSPPAIEQFPRPLMGPYVRRHGGLIIHVLVAIFTFLGLAIICKEYFISPLYKISEELKLTPDVAGATFMAVGSSAPQLATAIIGVFYAQDDLGVSGVIGSAVFNIIFVISVCALCAGTTVSHLNWWPLYRDCFFYIVSIVVMLSTTLSGLVSYGESILMLIVYVVYCVVLHFNTPLKRWSARSGPDQRAVATDEQDANVADTAQQSHQTPVWDPNSTWNSNPQQPSAPALTPAPTPTHVGDKHAATDQQLTNQVAPPMQTYYRLKERDSSINPLEKPINPNPWQMVYWVVAYPVHWSARNTMPDCRGRWYPITFIVSILWISFYSYFMVWMITIIGTTLKIPDALMGLTFVAAGVSVPNILSSLAVIKEGYSDMAVSNAVGSNVFVILVCLGLPWFIQTTIFYPGSSINVNSKGLVYSALSLFSTVAFLVVATHANGWKMDRKYGIILMVWYLLFIASVSLYELNVFGPFHPPDCYSMF